MQLLVRGWAAGGGWFFADDFWWHDIVARTSIWDTAGLSLGGHYSPLTYIPYWLITWWFPYEWSSRVFVMLLTLMGINLGVLAVVRRLWSSRGPQLAVYVLWASSSLAAPSWLWYSQFSMIGALLLTSTWTLWAYMRALESERKGPQVLALVMLVVSLFAQERMIVIAVLLLAFVLFICRPSLISLDWRPRGFLWTGSFGVIVLWGLAYLSVPSQSPNALASGPASLAVSMIRVSGLPALLGGPWVMEGQPYARAATPVWLQALAMVVLALVVWWSLRHNRPAWRAWALLAAAFVVDALAVAVVRGGTLGGAAIGEFRYFSDLAVLAPLLVVAAFVPPGSEPAFGRRERAVVATGLIAMAISGVYTTVALGSAWHRSESRPVAQRVQAELRTSGPVVIMDRVMPTTVVNKELLQQRFASRVFSIVDTEAVFDAPTTAPMWIDDEGRLVPGGLSADRRSRTGDCVYPVTGVETTWVTLAGPADIYDWGVRIDYRAEQPVTAGVTDGHRTVDVPLPAGQHSAYIPMPGVGERVGVFLVDPDQSICVDGVVAGSAQAR